MASKKGYNYQFRLYMEGVHVPFHGAVISCTPNGVEANINLWANKELLDLKPKTAVQIIYREWHKKPSEAKWLIAFDGFLSSFYKVDQAGEGNNISLVCRDFRMDIRRAPAAIAWDANDPLTPQTFYNEMGLFQTFVIKGVTKSGQPGTDIRIYDSGDLAPLSYTLSLIAGSAFGGSYATKHNTHVKGESTYQKQFTDVTPTIQQPATKTETKKDTSDGVANCGFFLDAIVRGLWVEAVGGTSVGSFLNKRIRLDKRFLIPVNVSGYNFWKRQSAAVNIGSHLMGNARFTSLEAAIMNLAGVFSTRVYSCNTPSLIPIDNDSPAVDYIMDRRVRSFILGKGSKEFGGKYILNESMLLPPLEFTAPPNCNFIFPPMCNRVEWQYDTDVDITRGVYEQISLLSTPGSDGLAAARIQVPNALFNIMNKNPKDEFKRRKPPLTLEERYKGINVEFGSVSVELACNDASSIIQKRYVSDKDGKKIDLKIDELKKLKDKVESGTWIPKDKSAVDYSKEIEQKQKEKKEIKLLKSKGFEPLMTNALKHHAVLKFLNSKYAGRVVVVDMAFNPFIMSGFPGVIVSDNNEYGKNSSKTILGMVQVVRHTISISSAGGDANTSVTMNNARFEDEPTDVDLYGYPLYIKETNPEDAMIDIKTFKHINSKGEYVKHYVTEPKTPVEDVKFETKDIPKSKAYDLIDKSINSEGYKYAKDLLSLTLQDYLSGKVNQIYIDETYEPTRICKFYQDVFQHTELHFMIGRTTIKDDSGKDKEIYFTYDSIHEGLEKLRINRPDLLSDYSACMSFTERNICSADAFFQGIIGLSIESSKDYKGNIFKDSNDNVITKYFCNQSNFIHQDLYERYYGVSTDDYNNKNFNLKKENGGDMTGSGQFSSIRENSPVTAYIKERRDAVETYLTEVLKRVSSI